MGIFSGRRHCCRVISFLRRGTVRNARSLVFLASRVRCAPTDAEAVKEIGDISWDGSTVDASFAGDLFDLAFANCWIDREDRGECRESALVQSVAKRLYDLLRRARELVST